MIKVLIADDDYLVIEELKSLVDWERLGYSIAATAKNGEMAYKRYVECMPQVVISDASMPGMDGLDLLEKIRERNHQTYVVMISSYADFQFAKRALRAGAFDYIMKEELTAELLETKLNDIAERIRSSQWNENRITRTLLSDFFCSTDTPEQFLQKNVGAGVRIQDMGKYLYQKRIYFYITFKEGLTYKPQSDNSYMEDGKALLLAMADTKINAVQNSVMFYLNRGLVIGIDGMNKSSACITWLGNEIVNSLKAKTSKCVISFYTGKQERLASFRDLVNRMRKTVRFLTVFSDQTLIDLSAVKPPIISNKRDVFAYSLIETSCNNPEPYYKGLHDFLIQLFQSYDIDRVTTLYRNILSQYERLGSPIAFSSAQYFSGLDDVWTFLKNEYEKVRDEHEKADMRVYSNAVQRIMQFISKEFRDPDLHVEQIADHVGLSAGRISVLFRKETGKTINDYLTEVRMEHAIYLLTNTNLKIYEIASGCGYRSAQYFTKVFNSKSGKRLVDYK